MSSQGVTFWKMAYFWVERHPLVYALDAEQIVTQEAGQTAIKEARIYETINNVNWRKKTKEDFAYVTNYAYLCTI